MHIALDFFDASLNRIGAWILGTRATLKAFLLALLQPNDKLKQAEENGDYFARLALLEEMKTKPFGAVWDYYCLKNDVAVGQGLISEVHQYEKEVTGKR